MLVQPYVIITALALVGGSMLIVGAYQRWSWLVDPPTRFWPFYSQSLIKRVFGATTALLVTYFIGLILVSLGIASIFWHLSRQSP